MGEVTVLLTGETVAWGGDLRFPRLVRALLPKEKQEWSLERLHLCQEPPCLATGITELVAFFYFGDGPLLPKSATEVEKEFVE